MRKTGIILVLLLFYLAACAPGRVKDYPTLVNQGILPLSTTNPYVGANLFLARELEQSANLYNFFKGRGAPTAIELTQGTVSAPHIIMYYPREREVYAADLLASRQRYEWIIRGPYQIERVDFRQLMSIEASMNAEPEFLIYGKPYRFRFHHEKKREKTFKPTLPPTPYPTPKPKPRKIIKKAPKKEKKTEVEDVDFSKLNFDQRAILLSQGFAERASNGDIIHTVKGEHETIEALARWYTKDAGAAKQIASINSKQPAEALLTGTRIRIPKAMLKRFKVPPDDFK